MERTDANALLQQIFTHKPGPVFATTLVNWYQTNRRNWPWRILFEKHGDPYHVWVSEIMLQQTTIQAVLPAYHRFFGVFPAVRDLAAADEDAVRLACRGLGYYRRFRMMHAAAQVLVSASTGKSVKWPRTFEGWKELPGIGDYTAAAISSICFGVEKAVVDGNVERVFCRLFDLRVVADPQWKRIFQKVGDRLIVGVDASAFNQGLMELGQDVCTKTKPKCGECPVAGFCASRKAGSQDLAPAAKPPMEYIDVRMRIVVPRRGDLLGLIERKKTAKFLGGTLGFPTAIAGAVTGKKKAWDWESEAIPADDSVELGEIKHSITKHKLQVEVHSLAMKGKDSSFTWLPIEAVEERLVSNLDRKALQLLIKKNVLASRP